MVDIRATASVLQDRVGPGQLAVLLAQRRHLSAQLLHVGPYSAEAHAEALAERTDDYF